MASMPVEDLVNIITSLENQRDEAVYVAHCLAFEIEELPEAKGANEALKALKAEYPWLRN